MNKKLVVNLLLKKTHRFLFISMIALVVSLTVLNFIASFIMHQYETLNRDYFNNSNVKVIHVDSKDENNFTTDIEIKDTESINQLLKENKLHEKARAYPVYFLPTVFDSTEKTGIAVMGVHEDLAFLVGENCQLNDNSICVNENDKKQLTIEVPVIEEKDGGFISSQYIDVQYSVEEGATRENSIIIQSAPDTNQAYVNEKEAENLLGIMFQNSPNSDEYIRETHLHKIIVYVKDVKDVDTVGELLKKENYYTSYTFNSFENFSVNLSAAQHILIMLSIFFALASIVIAVLLLVNYFRVQRKEIAILKLNGYNTKSIQSIYSRLMAVILLRVFIISIGIYALNLLFKWIPVALSQFLLVGLLNIIILVITLFLSYIFGIKKTAGMEMADLLKKGKEFD